MCNFLMGLFAFRPILDFEFGSMQSEKKLKSCKNGHRFYKSSDCPTCPICEQEKKPTASFMAGLAAPARRALENQGVRTLDQLASHTEAEVLGWHGMGKSSIPKLKRLLDENQMQFKSQ